MSARKFFTPEQKVAILREHLLDNTEVKPTLRAVPGYGTLVRRDLY